MNCTFELLENILRFIRSRRSINNGSKIPEGVSTEKMFNGIAYIDIVFKVILLLLLTFYFLNILYSILIIVITNNL